MNSHRPTLPTPLSTSSAPAAATAARGALLLGLLDALLRRAEKSTSVGDLGLALGASATDTADGLLVLERRGRVDAERLRLTLTGLAAASALRGASELHRHRAAARLAA